MIKPLLLFIVLLLAACGGNNYPVPMPEFPHRQTTPRGVKVRSTVNVPVSVLENVDNGIQDQLTKINHDFPQWQNLRTFTDYKVDFVDPMATSTGTNSAGCPALLVQGYNAAGTVYGVRNDGLPPTIVLPQQQAVNWRCTEYLRNTIFYESEHLRESKNDQDVFEFFATGPNDIHPHNYKLLPQ